MIKNNTIIIFALFSMACLFSGCRTTAGNVGQLQAFPVDSSEASWIRNGEPIEFEAELWFPSDEVESLLDSEVYLVGEYKQVRFFVEKTDVRPYNRLYTKFSKNLFRYFERKND